MPVAPLLPERLRTPIAPSALPFETTEELAPIDDPIGQERATRALAVAVGVAAPGYNVYVAGPPGVGRRTLARSYLEQVAAGRPVPDDQCYVIDVARPEAPRWLRLPPGRGRALRADVAQLVGELRTILSAAFESDAFRNEKERIEQAFKGRHERRLEELRQRAAERKVAVLTTPMGLALAPLDDDRKVIEPDAFEALPREQREAHTAVMNDVKRELEAAIEEAPGLQKQMRAAMRELVRTTVSTALRHHVDDVKAGWKDVPQVLAHLDAIAGDVGEHVEDFLRPADGDGEEGGGLEAMIRTPRRRVYQVNVLVDHDGATGAPVVHEDHPTFTNLLGRIEHLQRFGALVTDVGLIKPGALHRANGGFLILDARAVLAQPFAWEGLKRALLSKQIRLEAPGQAYGLVSTVSLEPEPIPLDVKVVLIGDRELYYLLDALDPDFRVLFKVLADFDAEIARTEDHVLRYARLLAGVARGERLPPLHRDAVARTLEHASRLAGDSGRMSAEVMAMFDVLREAALCARGRGAALIERADVDAALAAQDERGERVRARTLQAIDDGTLVVATDGARIGQVNGLSVSSIGRASFGRPTRITARVRLGKGEVVDIEREVELGGPIHSKGVMILAALLGARYAADRPLSLHASLVFEQSYGPVEGDSASCAELCALLSALAGVPIRQDRAITGAINQHGEVQAIGGVNEKIEGFFAVCRARGLTGAQGVIIPAANVRHLMLRADVVAAVAEGRFAIWPVSTVDEAIELLTGVEAGAAGEGGFPAGTLNGRVAARLAELAAAALDVAREAAGEA
jgi:lon-related putative ATP-dependent protease